MRIALVASLCASLALAETPDGGIDAPRAVVLVAGQPAPSAGMFLPEPLAIASEKDRQACHAERDSLAKAPPVAVLVLIGVALLGGGIAAGFGIAQIKQ